MASVGELLANARFPLVAIHPRHWRGSTYLGDVQRIGDDIISATLVYEGGSDGAGAAVILAARAQTISDDLARFVARFDPRAMAKRIRRRRDPFPAKSFASIKTVLQILGAEHTVALLSHGELPLQLARVATADDADAWVCGWRTPVRDLLPLLEPVDGTMVRAFDGAASPVYPPPEWTPDP